MLYICAKFHEIISNGIKVIEWTQKVAGYYVIPSELLSVCPSTHAFWHTQKSGGVLCFVPKNSLVMLYISTKFCEIGKITKGNNSAKNEGGASVVNLCTSSVMLYISTKFCEIISNCIKVIEWTRFLY